jgi:hypothetical protein
MAFMVIVYSKPSARIQDAQVAIADLSNGTWHEAVEPLIHPQRKAGHGRLRPAWPYPSAGASVQPESAHVGADHAETLGQLGDHPAPRVPVVRPAALADERRPATGLGDAHAQVMCIHVAMRHPGQRRRGGHHGGWHDPIADRPDPRAVGVSAARQAGGAR